MMKRGVILALAAGLCLSAGCTRYEEVSVTAGVKETEETKVIQITEPETEPETEGDRELLRIEKDGKIPSYLTGEMTDLAIAWRRPVAIMISNDKAALPHYGINHAGVIYEAPVEGGMNRFMAVIEDYDNLERIGSVRSCRTYYTFLHGNLKLSMPILARVFSHVLIWKRWSI